MSRARQAGPLPDIEAKHIIVATGARARTAGLKTDGRLIWTYHEAMVPQNFPQSLLIVAQARAPSASSSQSFIAASAPR